MRVLPAELRTSDQRSAWPAGLAACAAESALRVDVELRLDQLEREAELRERWESAFAGRRNTETKSVCIGLQTYSRPGPQEREMKPATTHTIPELPGLTETKPGSATFPLPGVEADVVDETTGESVEQGQGLLVLKRPWPGMLRTLYGDDDLYIKTYWSRFGPHTYLVGDAAIRYKDGYLWIVGRIDDVINVSGHRLSTAEVESAIVAHEKVVEAAVVAQSDELSGQAIVAFVTLQGGLEGTPQIEAQIREHVSAQIGKLARPKRILWTENLPTTRSGKIMRRLLRDIAEGRALGDVTTLRDPAVMAVLEQKVSTAQALEG